MLRISAQRRRCWVSPLPSIEYYNLVRGKKIRAEDRPGRRASFILYNERRKLIKSCFCEMESVLNFSMTELASEPQVCVFLEGIDLVSPLTVMVSERLLTVVHTLPGDS